MARFFVFVAVTAILYLAREVLIPLAVAILFTLLLTPAVRRLESWKLRRIPSVLIVAALALAVLASVGWVTGNQFLSLAVKLPEYRENIVKKLRALRSPPQTGQLGKAAEAIKEIANETKPPEAPPAQKAAPPPPQVPTTPLEIIGALGVPVLTLLGTILAVVVLTIFMLLQRDDLRDRLIRLVGAGKLNVTTQAMHDAGKRVSRYLMMQLIVNACFGVPLAIALHFIGIPNAALWGLLATILRFIPYMGAWVAASLPILLAFAISDGWSQVLWTAGTVVVLETTVAYAIEPWLYGQSTGLSPLAIVGSVVFWSWLWGPIGLLVSTPLTVCLATIGRHIPEFGYLNVMLGVEPVLPPQSRFYQRLLAGEQDEALEVALAHAAEHSPSAAREEILLPTLFRAKQDRSRDQLSERRERFVGESVLRVHDELGGARRARAEGRAVVCIVPANGEPDAVAAEILADELAVEDSLGVRVLEHSLLAAEVVEEIGKQPPAVACISAVPPSAVAQSRYLCKRLRERFPDMKIVVALWCVESIPPRAEQRLKDSGADVVTARLQEAAKTVRELALPAALQRG